MLQEAAARGDADAQFELARLYEYGEEVEQDCIKAITYYRLAAEQGDAEVRTQTTRPPTSASTAALFVFVGGPALVIL